MRPFVEVKIYRFADGAYKLSSPKRVLIGAMSGRA